MDNEEPYKDDKDRWDEVTAEMMIKMLKKVPGDYLVKFDSAYGHVMKGDFTVYHDNKEISING